MKWCSVFRSGMSISSDEGGQGGDELPWALDGEHVAGAGDDDRFAVWDGGGQAPRHLGGGPGIALAGDGERGDVDVAKPVGDLRVPGGEYPIAVDEALRIVGLQDGPRPSHPLDVDVRSVIPTA